MHKCTKHICIYILIYDNMNFYEKCEKNGGTVDFLDGKQVCKIPNDRLQKLFGETSCEKIFDGFLVKNVDNALCHVDHIALDFIDSNGQGYFGIGNFHRFIASFKDYRRARKLDREFGTEITYDEGVSGSLFEDTIQKHLSESHLFEVSNGVKLLLSKTKPPNKNDMFNLPFKTVFIDVNFKKDEMLKFGIDIGYDEIIGIMVTEGKLVKYRDSDFYTTSEYNDAEETGRALRITLLGLHDGHSQFDVFNRNYNLKEEYKDRKIRIRKVDSANKKAQDFVHDFTLNFLNFIYSPEVTYKEKPADEKRNDDRIKQGITPLPPRNYIKLTGAVKRYAQDINDNPQKWQYSHRFYVMGHYRTLQHPRYGKNVGKRVWVDDFIKGDGVLIEKTYQLKKDD